jgi:hypothetical protein
MSIKILLSSIVIYLSVWAIAKIWTPSMGLYTKAALGFILLLSIISGITSAIAVIWTYL